MKENSRLVIATHVADIDGIGSAALFLRYHKLIKSNKEIIVLFKSVNEMYRSQEELDYSFDLPKVEGVKINIDHHYSNYRKLLNDNMLTDKDLVDPDSPAAGDLVYKYFFTTEELKSDKISIEIRDLAVAADSGRLPDEFRPLDYLIKWNGDSDATLRRITNILMENGYKTLEHPEIIAKYNKFQTVLMQTKETVRDYFSQNISLPEVLFIDTNDAITSKLAKEVVSHCFSRGVIILAIFSYSNRDKMHAVSFRVRKENQSMFDVRDTAEKLGGGGHPMASAARGKNKQDFIKRISRELEVLALNNGLSYKYMRMADSIGKKHL